MDWHRSSFYYTQTVATRQGPTLGGPLLVEMARDLHEVLTEGRGDGRDILRKLLKLNSRLSALSKDVARQVLRMPREAEGPGIPNNGDGG